MSRERPAEYAHIPDIRNDPVTTSIVLFVVGLVLQGVSYLLSPKPNLPQQSRQPGNRQLDSIAGRDRFAPTYGFQSAQELSRYNEVIPIVFTRQIPNVKINNITYDIGGVMISPKLVWSRTYSFGSYQTIELVFLAGQAPMERPSNAVDDRSGVYIGQLPLDSFIESDYRWYFNSGGSPNQVKAGYAPVSSRLLGEHKRSGDYRKELGESPKDNAFQAITLGGLTSEAFSHTFSPTTKNKFGVYNGLPNGTSYRLNMELIPYMYPPTGQQAAGQGGANYTPANEAASAKLAQISGTPTGEGTGRNYGRQFGIVKFNDQTVSVGENDDGIKKVANIGDTIEVVYNAAKVTDKIDFDKNLFGPIIYMDWYDPTKKYAKLSGAFRFAPPDQESSDNKSIQNAIKTEHEQQDDLLKLGSRWLIGNALWEVISRTPENTVYDRSDKTKYTARLKCVEKYDDTSYVGVCDYKDVTTVTHFKETIKGPVRDIDSAWFPLCKADIAIIQNSRKCEVTEIGLKSNVWARLNGICNFQSLISPAQKMRYDYENVPVTAGTNQSYMRRASFFHLHVRPANGSDTPDKGWVKLSEYPFCIVGSTPQDQYNFIRIAHPRDQFEFRFRPVTSGELVHIIGIEKNVPFGGTTIKGPCVRLNVEAGVDKNPWTDQVTTKYGTFTLRTRGAVSSIASLALNSEMISESKVTAAASITMPLTTVRLVSVTLANGTQANAKQISNGITRKIQLDPDDGADPNTTNNKVPTWSGSKVGAEYEFNGADQQDFKYITPGQPTRTVTMAMRLRVEAIPPVTPGSTRKLFWTIANSGEIPATFSQGNWKGGDKFTVESTLFDTGTPKIFYNFEVVQPIKFDIPPVVQGERIFEPHGGIAEVSHYGSLISRSCDNGPEHEIVYVNESLQNDASESTNKTASYTGCAMAGLKLRSGPNITQIEQLHIYQKEGIQVLRWRDDLNPPTVGPSNVFTDLVYYLLTDKNTGIGDLISTELIDTVQLKRTGSFLSANNLRYDDVLVEPQNLREFFARISTSLLCNLVTRAGKFSIEPALPIDEKRNYTFLNVKVPISGIFTEGNIIEGSFQLEYIPAQERLPIRALVRYREESPNRFPQEKTVVVYRTDDPNGPLEEFSFTHITTRYHAELFAKYALSSRHHRTHAVTFKTTPYGLSLAPGDYIRVVTQSGYTNAAKTGIINSQGHIITPEPLPNLNPFEVYLWNGKVEGNQVLNTSITPVNKDGVISVTNTNQFNTIFAEITTSVNDRVYMVDSIDLDEEGLVQITASYFPINSDTGVSKIAEDLDPANANRFTVIADLSPE